MDVTDSPSEPGGPLPAAPAGRRRTIVMIGAVVAVLAVVLVAVALASDDDRTMFGRHDVAASRRVERACQQWLDDQARPTPDAAPGWCDHMGDWMYEQMASGRRGSEMWRDPWGDARHLRGRHGELPASGLRPRAVVPGHGRFDAPPCR
jgi:hypothetical protein